MIESNPTEELRVKVTRLESQVQRLNNIFWVVGIVAVIFGVAGGWGAKTLSKAKDELESLNRLLSHEKGAVIQHVSSLLSEINKHYTAKKKDFDLHVDSKMGSAVNYGDTIALQLPFHRNFKLSGGSSVRTSTTNVQRDEKWQIVKLK